MKVTLLAYTPKPEWIVAAAARCCYSNNDPDALMKDMTDEKAKKLIEKLNNLGHASPLEHVSFTFSISGVSRSLLAQITRHRLCSFSVRSQRYCRMDENADVVPPSIGRSEEARSVFADTTNKSYAAYRDLMSIGISKEDARFVLPESTKTAMVVTMNARELLHFFSVRCCNRAQWEIQTVANEMLKLVKEIAPTIFSHAGASCAQLGYCPEGNMSCGKAPTLDKLLQVYY